jgi:phosphatidylglycerol:prolipoprotein diacylglycerol transferase
LIPYPRISPTIVRIGPFQVRWYGLMYLLGFASSYLLFRYQVKKKKPEGVTPQVVENLYFWLILALVVGARLGYVIFYNPGFYIREPLKIFAVWEGGMSFHGGLIGVFLTGIIFARVHKLDFWLMTDLFVPTIAPGLFFGRMGNFINGELFGRPSNVPWTMVFPEGGNVPRHPSQLYEALFEGVILFLILWLSKDRLTKKRRGLVLSLFLILYGIFRFSIEFTRQPDPQLGFILGPFTMGQVLSGSMFLAGLLIGYIRLKSRPK